MLETVSKFVYKSSYSLKLCCNIWWCLPFSYCDCFAAGLYCAELCACHGCYNRSDYDGTVLETRQQIELRNPLAFTPKIVHDNELNSGVWSPFGSICSIFLISSLIKGFFQHRKMEIVQYLPQGGTKEAADVKCQCVLRSTVNVIRFVCCFTA